MIGIRVDANSTIAAGHMMRCITIAGQIVKQGGMVTFFISDDESKKLLCENIGEKSKGFDTVILHTDYSDPESELPVLIEQLQLRNIDTLIIDSYYATYDYIRAIDRVSKTVYIDDLNETVLPVDMLINYNVYSDRFDYENAYSHTHGHNDSSVRLLLGPMYAPLREQFAGQDKSEDKGQISDIMLAVGGADTCNMILPILNAIDESILRDRLTWHIVIGDYATQKEEIIAFASLHDRMKVHISVKDMAGLMRECDLAVCAAGTMLTECAAMRLPAAFFEVADNQRYVADYWRDNKGMIYSGNALTDDKDKLIGRIIKSIDEVMNTPGRAEELRDRLGNVTDGLGAERIAKEVLAL